MAAEEQVCVCEETAGGREGGVGQIRRTSDRWRCTWRCHSVTARSPAAAAAAVAVGVVEVVVELVVEWWWLPRAVGGGTALLWNIALCKCCSSGCSPLQSATDALAQQWDIRIPCSLSMFLSTEMKPTFCNELDLSP